MKKYIHKIKLMFSLTVYMLPFTLLLFNELCCASLLFAMLSQKVIKKTNPKSHTRSQALEEFIYK